MIDRKTRRVHTHFHQTSTATGRLSSSDPNLQNIPIRTPRGEKVRRALVAPEGMVILSADYSQIELRILADLSGDPDLVASFQRGEDIHRRTASELYACSPEAVTDTQRSIAKAINFGLMYGKTAFGLAQELSISRKEAAEMIDKYFTRYAGVKATLDRLIEEARASGMVKTVLGRTRPLTEIHSRNPAVRANAERMAMNTPIQGTAADLMKLAMIALAHRLRTEHSAARMLIQVHDELVLEVPKDDVATVARWTREAMMSAARGAWEARVPFEVQIASGPNWLDQEPLVVI
jgi:DNA polymerase-1